MPSNTCTECGGELPAAAQFCPACGARTRPPQVAALEAAPVQVAIPQTATPETATPPASIPPAAAPERPASGTRRTLDFIKLVLLLLGGVAAILVVVAAFQALGKWLPSLLR